MNEQILWCMQQKKGIKIATPNDNLCKTHIEKANIALKSMQANIQADLKEWIITTAYYAKYNAAYALLMKCGFKSEIHDCTIALVKYLFSGMLSAKAISGFEKSKDHRISTQYYADKNITGEMIKADIETAPEFVLEVEKLIEGLTRGKIEGIRAKMRN